MTGQQEVDLLKRTGPKLPSLPPTETSMNMLVFGRPENLHAIQTLLQTMHG